MTATVTLPAGVQTLTVDQDSNGFNFHYLAFATGSGGGTPPGGGGTGKYCGTTDLAMDQPTTASSVQASSDYLPYYATDGDPGTRWSSASSDPQWLEVDLGTPTADLQRRHPLGGRVRHRVPDPGRPTTTRPGPRSTPPPPAPAGQETFPISTTARYIRMYGTARAHHVRLLDLRVRRLRPDQHPAAGRRQRQRRQRDLPVGRLHRAGRHPGPGSAQHHGPGRSGQPALRRRHLVLHRPGQRHPRSVHPVHQHGGRPVRSR